MRISDWSSDVCSSDLLDLVDEGGALIFEIEPAIAGIAFDEGGGAGPAAVNAELDRVRLGRAQAAVEIGLGPRIVERGTHHPVGAHAIFGAEGGPRAATGVGEAGRGAGGGAPAEAAGAETMPAVAATARAVLRRVTPAQRP